MTLKINHYYEETNRQRCRPKQVIIRDRLVLVFGEPSCGKPYGPGVTSSDESRVTCPDCLARKGVA